MNDDCELVSTPDAERWQHRCEFCRLTVRTNNSSLPCARVPTESESQPQIAASPPPAEPPIEQPPQAPSLPRRLANFTQAATSHLLAGLPQASQSEIDRRFAICQTCPLFNRQICTHSTCGCSVNSEAKFLNKLAWADEKCPLNKWGTAQS